MSHADDARDDHPLALPSGTLLNEYRLDAVLGQGGFGITYLAFDTLLHEKVALKEYFPGDNAVRTRDLSARARSAQGQKSFQTGLEAFLDEARIIARFRHPNIMQVRRFFEAHGTGYIVLNYEVGRSLEDVMANAPLPEACLMSILAGILRGLEAVHDSAVLHRDLKPRNVIIREDGAPVLLDFGAARDFGLRNSFTVTQIASSGYSPPEQYGVGDQHGPWSDLYALGGIAYRGVTGRVPLDALTRLRDDPLVPAAKVAAGRYSPALLRTIDRMLRVDETRRPVSVADVRRTLPGLEEVATVPLTAFPDHPATVPFEPDQTRRFSRVVPRRRASTLRAAGIAGSIAAILLIGIAGAHLLSGRAAATRGESTTTEPVPSAQDARSTAERIASSVTDRPLPRTAEPGPSTASSTRPLNPPRPASPRTSTDAASATDDRAASGSAMPGTAAPAPSDAGRDAQAPTVPPAQTNSGASPSTGRGPPPPSPDARRAAALAPSYPSDSGAAGGPVAGDDHAFPGQDGLVLNYEDADPTGAAFDAGTIPFLTPLDRLKVALEEARGGETALALSSDGKYGVASGQDTAEQARSLAAQDCEQAGGADCRLYSADGSLLWPGRAPVDTTSLLAGPIASAGDGLAGTRQALAHGSVRPRARAPQRRTIRTASCGSSCRGPVTRAPRAAWRPRRRIITAPRQPTLADYLSALFGGQQRGAAAPHYRVR